ncbi:UbiX family flavin prenyltransferase [Arhodomonas aquaeolei]|uniref:UbiX family flavin prenyltransferase n=1 Tax=Arhodomonas aquaeolei TaxID=2369 RepID=UPI0003A76143|nr:UbiX family flavin prenyltransferase [Arhodomonas aquaeolei]MCS4505589.1 UbiX family flavin prenyltransferase [Arhodomonas aquaeolei]
MRTSTPAERPRMIVGVTGASGTVIGMRLLERLRALEVDTHLVMSRAAHLTLHHELGLKPAAMHALADTVHPVEDVGAAISSGSFRTLGMIVAPCSMKTLAEIATGVTGNLLSRAADVVLKERQRLVLLARETPLHAVHLRNMLTVTEMGGIVVPPVPAFYNEPRSIDDILEHIVGRTLDLFGLDTGRVRRWGGEEPAPP